MDDEIHIGSDTLVVNRFIVYPSSYSEMIGVRYHVTDSNLNLGTTSLNSRSEDPFSGVAWHEHLTTI